MSDDRQESFNRRQLAMHAKLRRLGFVPVVWQRKDGEVWIEEQYQEPLPFAVDTSYGDTIRASVSSVGKAIAEAVKSLAEREALAEAERAAWEEKREKAKGGKAKGGKAKGGK